MNALISYEFNPAERHQYNISVSPYIIDILTSWERNLKLVNRLQLKSWYGTIFGYVSKHVSIDYELQYVLKYGDDMPELVEAE